MKSYALFTFSVLPRRNELRFDFTLFANYTVHAYTVLLQLKGIVIW